MEKKSTDTIKKNSMKNKGIQAFQKTISLKATEWLEIELAYFTFRTEQFSSYATRTMRLIISFIILWFKKKNLKEKMEENCYSPLLL